MTTPSEEDSGNETPELQPEDLQDLAQDLDPAARARQWADDIRTRPLDDDQATALAAVYASLAAVEAYERTARALEALQQPLERFLALWSLSGGPEAPGSPAQPQDEPVSPHEPHRGTDEQEQQ